MTDSVVHAHDAWRQTHLGRLLGHAMRRIAGHQREDPFVEAAHRMAEQAAQMGLSPGIVGMNG